MTISTYRHVPILLTSSVIAHDKGVRLQNPELRRQLALESIHAWRTIAPDNPLVLCDGSGFDFSELTAELQPQGQIESLHFQNNVDMVMTHGRGYGEGEIVRHAVAHSRLIATAGCFAKCTSKLWVDNFHACMSQWNGRMLLKAVFDNVFSARKPTSLSYIDTRFYAVSVQEYEHHFMRAHEKIQVQDGYGLEESFRDIFLAQDLHGCLMRIPPVISGVGGGTGSYYRNPTLRKWKENLRYRLASRDPLLRRWFV